jgi:murein DD-endopeptidase MepM/ murein hydrolase activator NlpD
MACSTRALASLIGLLLLVLAMGAQARDESAPDLAAGIRSQGFAYHSVKDPTAPGTYRIRYVFDEKHRSPDEQARIRGLALRLGVVDASAGGYEYVSWQDKPTSITLRTRLRSYPGFEYIMTGWKTAQAGGAQRVLALADAIVAINKQADPASASVALDPSVPPPRFAWPVQGPIAVRFGEMLNGRTVRSILIQSNEGTPVKAAEAGTVDLAGDSMVSIVHADGYRTLYLYTKSALVKKGDSVAAGQPIAAVGKAGTHPTVSGAVLGFGVLRNHEAINPMSVRPPQ